MKEIPMNAENKSEQLVNRLCDAFSRMNADELIAYFSDDAVYHNVPMPPLRGRKEIFDFFRGLRSRYDGLTIEILRQVSAGSLVMNERIDSFTRHGKRIALPICGVFELRSDVIIAWREYFDLATLTNPKE